MTKDELKNIKKKFSVSKSDASKLVMRLIEDYECLVEENLANLRQLQRYKDGGYCDNCLESQPPYSRIDK
jgi:hypothetical protein